MKYCGLTYLPRVDDRARYVVLESRHFKLSTKGFLLSTVAVVKATKQSCFARLYTIIRQFVQRMAAVNAY